MTLNDTLNSVIALILRYFTEFDSFGDYSTVADHRPIASAEHGLPLLAKTAPFYM